MLLQAGFFPYKAFAVSFCSTPASLSWKSAKDGFVCNACAAGRKPCSGALPAPPPSRQVSSVWSARRSPSTEDMLSSSALAFLTGMRGKTIGSHFTCQMISRRNACCVGNFPLVDPAVLGVKADGWQRSAPCQWPLHSKGMNKVHRNEWCDRQRRDAFSYILFSPINDTNLCIIILLLKCARRLNRWLCFGIIANGQCLDLG